MIDKTIAGVRNLSLIEKKWFPWRTRTLIRNRPAFFPGCNLVNFLPETAGETARIFKDLGAGWLYDCCGKPLKLAGDQPAASSVLGRINRQLKRAGVTELIVACPNCLSVFQNGLEIPVKDIYTFLKEIGIPCALTNEALQTFPPCPDRKTGAIRKAISCWSGTAVHEAKGLPCCGLGLSNPQNSRTALKKIQSDGRVLSPYCASCYGHLVRNGVKMKPHILTAGLGMSEQISKGFLKGINRLRPLFWKK